MSRGSSAVRYVQDIGVDASYSSIYQTKRDRVPRLLQTIRGYTNATATPPSAGRISLENGNNMDNPEQDDIMAPPLSSGDEEEHEAKVHTQDEGRANTTNTSKRKAQSLEHTLLPRKRARGDVKPTRVSKRIVQQSNTEPELPPVPSSSAPEIPDFISQSSQSKRLRNKYGRANSYNRPSSQDTGTGFADPGNLPATPQKSHNTSFQAPDSLPSSGKRTPDKKIKKLEIPLSAKKPKDNVARFKMPEEMDLPASSGTSTEFSKVLDDNDEDFGKLTPRKRSSSTSSLSSLDSIASYELSQTQKDSLRNGVSAEKPIPNGCVQCPLCQKIINLNLTATTTTDTDADTTDPTNLPLRKQQTFCQTHRTRDAQTEWQKGGYPTIDWTLLEKKRILKHTPHLRQVLYRKTPSFYLENLEAKVAGARGNQSKIRKYLATEVVEVVKTGYYGPKGAKVMGNKITSEMANHLKRGLKTDKTVRLVGVSGFVSAVLLPELLLRLVMDDMKIDDTDEARRVISETTEMGMLLWPDDDHVTGEDTDDEEVTELVLVD